MSKASRRSARLKNSITYAELSIDEWPHDPLPSGSDLEAVPDQDDVPFADTRSAGRTEQTMSRWFQNLCIRRKLNLVIFMTGCVALALASAALTVFTTMDLRAQTAREISTLADAFGSNASAALEFHNSQAAEEILAALRTDRRILVAAVLARDGSQFAHYSQPGIPSDIPKVRPSGFHFEGGTLLVERPILVGGERIGSILIRCSLQEGYGRVRRNLVVLIIMIAVSLLSSLLFTQRLQLTISGPCWLWRRRQGRSPPTRTIPCAQRRMAATKPAC